MMVSFHHRGPITEERFVLDRKVGSVATRRIGDSGLTAREPKARIAPLQAAVQTWLASLKDLQAMGPKFVQSFGDQAMCISGQIAAAANASTRIQANVNVSVSVSASASGSVGG